MSDLEWDADDYEPPAVTTKKVSDKWDGEDEDDDIKESWDDDDDDKTNNASEEAPVTDKRKKKKLADIIAEKERKKQEELARRKKEREESMKSMTPEEKLAEKRRIQKVQEDSDFALASELVGDKEDECTSLDEFDLTNKDDLESFRKTLVQKIRQTEGLEKKAYYVTFVEDLSRALCDNMEHEDIKRVTTVLNSLYNEKVKANKPINKKKKSGKATLKTAPDEDYSYAYDYEEFDDFI